MIEFSTESAPLSQVIIECERKKNEKKKKEKKRTHHALYWHNKKGI